MQIACAVAGSVPKLSDGDIDVSAPVSKKYVCEGGRFPSWKVGIEMMCDCCDNDTEDE